MTGQCQMGGVAGPDTFRVIPHAPVCPACGWRPSSPGRFLRARRRAGRGGSAGRRPRRGFAARAGCGGHRSRGAGDADWMPGRWRAAMRMGSAARWAAASARCLCAGRRPARAARRACVPPAPARRGATHRNAPTLTSPSRAIRPPSRARLPAGGARPGLCPDPGPPSEMSAHQVIPSPGQAEPYARTPRTPQGLAALGLRQTLASPGEPGAARRVSDRGDDLRHLLVLREGRAGICRDEIRPWLPEVDSPIFASELLHNESPQKLGPARRRQALQGTNRLQGEAQLGYSYDHQRTGIFAKRRASIHIPRIEEAPLGLAPTPSFASGPSA
jgi:hypothetical protein